MHPASLLSYYPTYSILDEIVSTNNYKTLNLYIDLKNCLQTTYMKHAIFNILENSKRSKFIDTSVFSSVLSFLSFHKMYAMKRGIKINYNIFFETGQSYYHKNISKKYKISRRIDDLYGLDRADRDEFFKILHANFLLIYKACNLLPSTKVFKIPNLEADFIPYYLITRNLIPSDKDTANVIYSNDHDLFQCINDNTFVFRRIKQTKKIIKKGQVMDTFLKMKSDIPDSYLPFAMSIIGDTGDDVYGIDKIGPTRFKENFENLKNMIKEPDHLYENIINRNPIFDIDSNNIWNKHLKKIISSEKEKQVITNNLKLVSFELISREVENPTSTEMLEKKKIIENIINMNNVAPIESLKKALEMNNVSLFDGSLEVIYL